MTPVTQGSCPAAGALLNQPGSRESCESRCKRRTRSKCSMRPGQGLVGTHVAPLGSSRAQTLPHGTTLGRLTCLRYLHHRWKKSALGITFQRVNRAGALGDQKCQHSEVSISHKLKGRKSHTGSALQWSLLLIYGKPQAVGLPVSVQGKVSPPQLLHAAQRSLSQQDLCCPVLQNTKVQVSPEFQDV